MSITSKVMEKGRPPPDNNRVKFVKKKFQIIIFFLDFKKV